MNLATWPPFATRYVLPRLPEPDDWTVVPFGMVRGSATWLMQCVAWNGASWLSVEAVVLPLYRPTDFFYFSWSRILTDRAGRRSFELGAGADADLIGGELAEAIPREGLEHLDQLGTLEGFAGMLIRRQADVLQDTGHRGAHAEELAYTLILLGYHQQAAGQLSAAALVDADAADWERASADRMALVRRLLEQDPQAAIDQLGTWSEQSAHALGVERAAP